MRELATIVVPAFQTTWHPIEQKLLMRAVKELPEFPFVFVCSEQLDTTALLSDFEKPTIYRFEEKFFADRIGFTKLTMTPDFYEIFGWSQYILLFEPCSYITKNQLRYWCKQGHDYLSDSTGRFSLRDVDRFFSLTKKGGGGIVKFIAKETDAITDRTYWQSKSTGFWPSLRTPTPIVSAYFSQPAEVVQSGRNFEEMPFAICDINGNSEVHERILQLLET